jgi:hypothetical protein
MENVGIFYGHCNMVDCNNLWSFGMLYQEKSGSPGFYVFLLPED